MSQTAYQVTQSFGDTGAAVGLEVAIVKFVCGVAVLAVTKWILEFFRYADNLLHSVETPQQYEELKEDLLQSISRYSMPLKYCISSQENDPQNMIIEENLLSLWMVKVNDQGYFGP